MTLNLHNSGDSLLFGPRGAKFTVGSRGKRAMADGCQELVLGNEDTTLRHLDQAAHLADGACFAGFLALKKGLVEEAAGHLTRAADKHNRLGRYLSKNGISAIISLPITDEISAHVVPNFRGVLLVWCRLANGWNGGGMMGYA